MKLVAFADLLALMLTAEVVGRQTWIVAQDGCGDFTEIQPAVDAASPGDLTLVKEGSHEHVWVDKPLSIVGSGT